MLWPGDLLTNAQGETLATLGLYRSSMGAPGTPIFADGFESGDVCEWSSFVGIPDPGCPPDFLTSTVTATYGSEGMLYALERDADPTARHVFYFGGRPVALRDLTGTSETWRWVTTDHLGTPIAATSTTGALLWSGGFEPFGRDFTAPSAQDSGVFLRLPGQWFDEAWEESSLGAEVYYNVHRWYEQGTGRYTRVDPADEPRVFHSYVYGDSRPLFWIDPDGERPTQPPIHDIPPPLPCIGAHVSIAFFQGSLGPNKNRWAHCHASCGITKCAGAAAAESLGLRKESLDAAMCFYLRMLGSTRNTFCNSAYQATDAGDNELGRACPVNTTCEDQCRDLRERPDISPGPFYDLPLE